MRYHIPLSKPYLDQADKQALDRGFQSSWISSKSPSVEKFERLFAKKVSQTKYAISVNSGTSALFLALKALGIGKGDEVILPSFTMIASINAIVWVGAVPVLVDSQSENDWNMNVSQIEGKITKRTKAILPVHIYGYACQMSEILKIAKKHRLFVVEDAAEAMGSTYHGNSLGSLGDLSCYSLYANKIITTGNGGMIATNNKKYYHLIKKLAFFDFNSEHHFEHNLLGYNLVLSGLQASLGVSQVKKFSKLLKKRQQIYSWYVACLAGQAKLRFIPKGKMENPNYWFPAIILENPSFKTKVEKALNKAKIESRNFFLPMHLQPLYQRSYSGQEFPVSEYFYKQGLLLPSFHELTKSKVKDISQVIIKALN